MHFRFLHWGVTLAGHVYDRRQFHDCNVVDCPMRIKPPETKYVIADRVRGSLSERFDTRHDIEAALRMFAPETGLQVAVLGHSRYEILETSKIFDTWTIADPLMPPDQIWLVNKGQVEGTIVNIGLPELDPDV